MSPSEIVVNVEVPTEIVTFTAQVPCASPGHEWRYCNPRKGQRYIDHERRLCLADKDRLGVWFLTEVPTWIVPDWLPAGWVACNGKRFTWWDSKKPVYKDGKWRFSDRQLIISELLDAWNHPEPRHCGEQAIWEIKPKAPVE